MTGLINKSNITLAHLAAIAVVIIWGSTFVSTKILLKEGAAPTEIFFIRFALAYSAMWIIGQKRVWCNNIKDESICALAGICGGSLYFITENMALQFANASNVALIVCTTPIFTIIFTRESRNDFRVWLGSLLSVIGTVTIILDNGSISNVNIKGSFLALCAALSWALYTLAAKKSIRKYGNGFVTRKIFFYGLITSLPLCMARLPYTEWGIYKLPEVWGNLCFLGIVASFACFLAWGWVINTLGSVKASNYLYLNPVAAAITAAIILSENITLRIIVGMAAILSGIYLAQRGSKTP